MSSTIYSFDVFDTLISRFVGSPSSLFLLVGKEACHRGYTCVSAKEFKRARIVAEQEARIATKKDEITLADIYQILAAKLGLTEGQAEAIKALEIEIEKKAAVALVNGQKLLSEARAAKNVVVFISDMYLPATVLKDILTDQKLWENGDRLWVSSETAATKQSGKLFRVVQEHFRCEARELLHTGDNHISDIAAAKRLGIRTRLVKRQPLSRYEEILEKYADETDGLSSLLAGTSRHVRSLYADSECPLCVVACGVAAPAVIAFVLHLLISAKERNITRLYFLSRDGQILLRVAKILAPSVGYGGELRYLYASRQAWRLPSISRVTEEEMQWAFEWTDDVSIQVLSGRLGLVADDLLPIAIELGIKSDDPNKPLTREELIRLRKLCLHKGFAEHVFKAATSAKVALTGYLKQEGLFDGTNYALVDLGWHGSLQASLERLIPTAASRRIHGFYFALRNSGPRKTISADGFFFDELLAVTKVAKHYWIEPLMEVFCAGDHSLTLRYAKSGESFRPIFNQVTGGAADWGVKRVHDVVSEMATFMAPLITEREHPRKLIGTIDRLCDLFWNFPTKREAECWGTFPYCDDQYEMRFREWAPKFRIIEVLRSLRAGSIVGSHKACWAPGALKRSQLIWRILLRHCRRRPQEECFVDSCT